MSLDQTDAVPLTVRRTSSSGTDRAYVKVGAEDVGYRDLRTGSVTCAKATDESLVQHATALMFARSSEARVDVEYAAKHRRPDQPAEPTPDRPQEPGREAGQDSGRRGRFAWRRPGRLTHAATARV